MPALSPETPQIGDGPTGVALTRLHLMALVVIQDESLGPAGVGLLGAVSIALETICIAHLIEQLL